nr:immunoglobulin heavy chain junction region [Macaca mulatta]MOX38317.1 immunoglobulin heavy chain junction region [Macaca mulatta]MOX41096.1 immunoglobulin heavy chain junction region [Macaca mulatta]
CARQSRPIVFGGTHALDSW